MYFKILLGLLVIGCIIGSATASGKNSKDSKSKDNKPKDSRSNDKGSKDCDSKKNPKDDDDDKYCKSVIPSDVFVNTYYTLCKGIKPLPTCTCGDISQIQIYNSDTKKNTTIQFCIGCTGSQVPLDSSSTCGNVPTIFRSYFNNLCSTLFPKCKKTVTFYSCRCSGGTTAKLGPPTTIKIPATTAKVLATTAKAPFTTLKIPATTVKAPATTVNVGLPVVTYKLPSTAVVITDLTKDKGPTSNFFINITTIADGPPDIY